ncbi:TPA: hypothetical protein HA244_03760 [Candidatus Micrarchaeota archaeon]|nr:hypothetical protein [Candidatus Micrarchaeota archaeon]
MANVTVSVSDDLKAKMDKHSIINWSEVARNAFFEQVEELELLQKITSKSTATEKDIDEISKKIRHGILKRHRLIR